MDNKLEKIEQNSLIDNFVKTGFLVIELQVKNCKVRIGQNMELRFSRQCLENLYYYYLGRIMLHYYKLKMRNLVNGMKKKL